jgi:hypothetical protein
VNILGENSAVELGRPAARGRPPGPPAAAQEPAPVGKSGPSQRSREGGPDAEEGNVTRLHCLLTGAGMLGFALAGLGHALGLRWLTTTGILLAGGSCVWLAAISQGRE